MRHIGEDYIFNINQNYFLLYKNTSHLDIKKTNQRGIKHNKEIIKYKI